MHRRTFCRVGSLSALGRLSGAALARAAVDGRAREAGKSLVVVFLGGGASQLETFDPHPGSASGGPTRAIGTAAAGVRIAEGLPRLAERMGDVSLIRSLVSAEGDHDRGRYALRTGYRPEPSLVHPSVGAVLARQLPVPGLELPAYVSILPGDRHASGGFLGQVHDPLRLAVPGEPPPNVAAPVGDARQRRRLAGLAVLEDSWRSRGLPAGPQRVHGHHADQARTLMTSDQLAAFRIEDEPQALRDAYGDNPFGRGCLVARRLVETGVRCVEVELDGWDSHADNFGFHRRRNAMLDPGLATLLTDLAGRDLLRTTLVLCVGEFGRTPKVNALDGRDHWPRGFSAALAGGGVPGGRVVGATDPAGIADPSDPATVGDLYATVLTHLGLDPAQELFGPLDRPIKLADGAAIADLL